MCRYCSKKRGFIRTQDNRMAYIQGDRFTASVVVLISGKYRIMTGVIMSSPIEFCPKCGRHLTNCK